MRGGVTFLAGDAGMLVHERITRQFVIELLEGRFPMNQGEIHAVVFQVAANTVPAVGIFHPDLRVVSLIDSQLLRDLFVAVETFESGCARAELVAGRALRCAIQGSVRLG